MTYVVDRLRTFQTPRLSVAILLLGLAGQSFARARIGSASTSGAVTIASLDTAIAAATPSPGDTSGRNEARLRDLVTRKRDAEVDVRQASRPWFYLFLLSGSLVLAAVVTGAQALIAHVRGEA